MPNPVAANDLSPISGSLQTSRISYGVETAGKNYGQNYNGTTWYSDIPQNGSQYTIISDNYTANYYVSRSNAEGAYVEGGLPAVDEYSAPVFWVTVGTSSLDVITIVNGLPDRIGQTPFNSGSQALNWVASSSNYFAVGPPYEQIDADNLRVYLDANQVISYPTTQSTWYDLSGYRTNGTLGDDITFDSRGWMEFNGTQTTDYNIAVPINRGELGNTMSIEATFQYKGSSGDSYRPIIGGNDPGAGTEFFLGKNAGNDDFGVQDGNYDGAFVTTPNVFDGRWHHMVYTYDNNTGKLYLDGILRNTGTFTKCNDAEQIYIGAEVQEGYWWHGNISQTKYYIKTLTAADVAQNYYGGPIVTNGLIYAIDAGNLVSYPKSGTTVYPLTGSNTDTLTNGVGFLPIDGGIWTFDGVDDYIYLDADPWPANAFTNDSISIWFKFSNYGVILGQSGVPPFTQSGWVPAIYIDTSFYLRTSVFWGSATGNQSVSPSPLSINTWYNVTVTNGNNTQKTYLNGELIATLSKTQASYNSTYYYTLGAGVWNGWTGVTGIVGYLQGQIANLYYYDKELTADEVLQNYNATK
jgi:hypothetical protein